MQPCELLVQEVVREYEERKAHRERIESDRSDNPEYLRERIEGEVVNRGLVEEREVSCRSITYQCEEPSEVCGLRIGVGRLRRLGRSMHSIVVIVV